MSTQSRQQQATTRGERSREAILEAAIPLLAGNGYRGASLASIAAAANLTQQGLLHHFRSKEELLLAVIEKRDLDDGSRLSALITGEGLALLDVLRALISHNEKERDEVSLFTTLVAEATSPQHPAHDYFVERYQRIRARVLRSLREGQIAGEIRDDVDVEALVPAIIAVMDGLQIQWLLDPQTDMAKSFATFVDLLRAELDSSPRTK